MIVCLLFHKCSKSLMFHSLKSACYQSHQVVTPRCLANAFMDILDILLTVNSQYTHASFVNRSLWRIYISKQLRTNMSEAENIMCMTCGYLRRTWLMAWRWCVQGCHPASLWSSRWTAAGGPWPRSWSTASLPPRAPPAAAAGTASPARCDLYMP